MLQESNELINFLSLRTTLLAPPGMMFRTPLGREYPWLGTTALNNNVRFCLSPYPAQKFLKETNRSESEILGLSKFENFSNHWKSLLPTTY